MLAWRVCAEAGLELWSGSEPLGWPRDEFLAEQVVARRALVRAEGRDLRADLTLVMAGFEFEHVWKEHRAFTIEGVSVPVAALHQIVQSKAHAGRPKDRLFLASHEDALRELMKRRP